MGAARNTWAKLITRHGLTCNLIRLGDPDVTVSVLMMRRYAEEDKLQHEVSQQDAWFIVEYVKLQGQAITEPVKNDRILSLGKLYTIFLVEPKIANNELVGWQMRCTGG